MQNSQQNSQWNAQRDPRRNPQRNSPNGPTLIVSVQRACRLLAALERRGGQATAKQLARDTQIPLPTTYHLLRTLLQEGMLLNAFGHYMQPPAAPELPTCVPASEKSAPEDWLERISRHLSATTYAALYRDGEVEVFARSRNTPEALTATPVLFGSAAHAHAAGQCLLARLTDAQRRDHFRRHPVFPLTPYTVPDTGTALRRLSEITPFQPVVEVQEFAMGYASAAVPISVGGAFAAISLCVPANRAHQLRSLTAQLNDRAEAALRAGSLRGDA
ncbi:helix-turn-helix domain-containing protein [Streptomyces sp. NPDC059009]|uniref:helix-turn-helix domain-containing protein n=1 Tax=Streptomyces sp. NPDC059009 TaxID=3346694 RepID=UPI00367A31C2